MDWTSLLSWVAEHYFSVLVAIAAFVFLLIGSNALIMVLRDLSRVTRTYDGHDGVRRRRRWFRPSKRRFRRIDRQEVAEATDEARVALSIPGTELAAIGRPKPTAATRALEIEAGRLVYQIPKRMWRGVPEKVEVRLGRQEAEAIMHNFAGRGAVRVEDVPIVETMAVALHCEPGAFDIAPRSEKDQLVKPDLVKGTALAGDDFAKWLWIVTPLKRGRHQLYVKVSAGITDSRGQPVTSALPDKIFPVKVRVRLMRTWAGAAGRLTKGLLWAAITALVGAYTKDYWWPIIRNLLGAG